MPKTRAMLADTQLNSLAVSHVLRLKGRQVLSACWGERFCLQPQHQAGGAALLTAGMSSQTRTDTSAPTVTAADSQRPAV